MQAVAGQIYGSNQIHIALQPEWYGANFAWRVKSRLKSSQQVFLSIWTCLRLKSVPYILQRSRSYELACDMQTGARGQKYTPVKLMFTVSESPQAWWLSLHTLSDIPVTLLATSPITLSRVVLISHRLVWIASRCVDPRRREEKLDEGPRSNAVLESELPEFDRIFWFVPVPHGGTQAQFVFFFFSF